MLDPIHVPVMRDSVEMEKPAMVCSTVFKYKSSLCNVNFAFFFSFNKLTLYLMNMVYLNHFLSLRNYRIPKSVMIF